MARVPKKVMPGTTQITFASHSMAMVSNPLAISMDYIPQVVKWDGRCTMGILRDVPQPETQLRTLTVRMESVRS